MNKRITILASVLLAACPVASWSGGVSDAVITKLAVNKGLGDILFIAVDKTKDSTPSCHINGSWTFVLPITSDQDKKIYALLLAARASQTPVSLGGNGACDVFGSIESLQSAFY